MLRRKVYDSIYTIAKANRPIVGSGSSHKSSSISVLQAAFRDPTSPFYIPESPDDSQPRPLRTLTTSKSESRQELTTDALESAREKLRVAGFDPKSFWEQHIVWGDHDAFQHVNNVRYARFFESSRIKWMISIGEELGGPSRGKAMMNGQGISLILKSIELRFKRPVTYPDTLLIGYRLLPPTADQEPSIFRVAASAYSLTQQAFVTHSTDTLVWYNYDKLKKCDPGERAWQVLRGRLTK